MFSLTRNHGVRTLNEIRTEAGKHMASQRIPLVAGNWKMNFDHLEATYFVQQLAWKLRDIHFDYRHCEIALMPSFTSLRSVQVLVESDNLKIHYGRHISSERALRCYGNSLCAVVNLQIVGFDQHLHAA